MMEQSVLSTTMAHQQAQGNTSVPLNGKDYMASMPKLSRGFSKVQANQDFINETRNHIENNYKNLNDLNELNYLNKFLNNELTCYSFMLPNLNQFEDYKFKEYLQNDLLEMPAQYNLTESGHLNWWTQNNWENVCRPLYPMITSGDGNCLLHAASLAMWGLHDRYLILRKALNSTLKQIKEDNTSPLWRRWKWEQMCQNRKYGLIYDEDEWAKEWHSLLKLSSYEPRVQNQHTTSSSCSSKQSNNNQSSPSVSSSSVKSNGQDAGDSNENGTCYFESLEEFHVFLLANILQRPIIIVSDTMLHDLNGDPLSPIPFGGIYLPFECELSKCHRYPLVLAYDSAHFSALVLMDEDENPYENDQAINGHNNKQQQADFDPDCILTNEEINQINKKLQLKPPYSIIPIQYSNKEILPVHFVYDPGEGYDWSKFPMRNSSGPNQTSTKPINSSSNDNMSVSSENKSGHAKGNGSNNFKQQTSVAEQQLESSIEVSRSEKMFIIQKYLDLCKLELFDPGPLSKRNTQVFNSSGMCASIHNIQVPEPLCLNGQDAKVTKSKSTSKLQKFFSNLFKKGGDDVPTTPNKKINSNTSEKNSNSIFASKLRKSLRNNYTPDSKNNKSTLISVSTNPQFQTHLSPGSPPSVDHPSKSTTLPSKLKSTGSLPNAGANSPCSPSTIKPPSTPNKLTVATTPNTNTVFHKVQTFKNWNSLFNALDNNVNSFLAVKLNLAKPPRFNQVIHNYIESAKHRIEMMKQHHKMQLLHQQQQHQLYLQQQMQQKDMQMRQNQQHQVNQHNQQQQQSQHHHKQQQIQHQQQQQHNLKKREVFEEQQRLTPRYITTNSANTRNMFNNDQDPNNHHHQQQAYRNTQNTNNGPGLKNLHEQQRKSRQSGSMYDDLEEIQHL